jgi:hypothetical protein
VDLGQLEADVHTALPRRTLEAEANFFLIRLLRHWWQLQEISTQDQLQSTEWAVVPPHSTSDPLQLLRATPNVKTFDSTGK